MRMSPPCRCVALSFFRSMPSPEHPTAGFSALHGLDAGRVLAAALCSGDAQASQEIPAPADLGVLLPEYDVQGVIGRGGMGAVYRAVQRKLARDVAIKVMPVEMGDAPGFADRFRREAMTTAGLAHPDIVAVHDAGETVAGHHYYVMDLVDGEDLAVRMARGRLPVEESVALLATVCGAVEAAHAKGIVHRDIKPSNILLTRDGKPKLADFGLALLTEKHLEYSRLTLGGTTLGTLEYAAPEQLAGNGATAASDQYSLGVLAYELLTGELPRGVFDPPSARNAEIDPAFDGVILRALQSDPVRRYASVAEFRAAILHAADRRAQQERRAVAARQKLRRRTGIAIAAATVALLTIGLAVIAWQQSQRAQAGESAAASRRDAAYLTRMEAEKLVDFMLRELQGRLFEVNRLDVLDAVVARVRAYYDAVPPEESRDDGFLLRKAEFIELCGALAGKHGRPEEALACYTEAQNLRRLLLDRHPRDMVFYEGYARGEFSLAGAMSDPAAAWQSYQNVIDAWLVRSGAPLAEVKDQMPLMAMALQTERLIDMQRHDEARTAAESLLARMELLLADPGFGGDFANQNVKAILLRALAGDARRRGEWQQVADLDRRRMQIYEQFLPRTGRNGYREYMFAEAAKDTARSLLTAGAAAEAAAAAAAGWAVGSRLSQDPGADNDSRVRTEALAAAWRAARRAQQLPDELSLLSAAGSEWFTARPSSAVLKEKELWSALTAGPEDDAAQFAWAMASEDLGKQIESSGGTTDAVRYYERQFARMEPLLTAAPPDTWWNLGASYTLNRLGVIKESAQDWAAAEPIFRRSLDLRRRTRAAHPGNPRECRNIASTAQRLARTLVALKRPAEADALWRELLAELQPIEGTTSLEWRALLIAGVQETLPALNPEAARRLAAAARDFLLARGEAALSATEKQSLATMEKSVGQ